MNGSNGNVVGLLERIAGTLDKMSEDQGSMKQDLSSMKQDLSSMKKEQASMRQEQASTRLELVALRRDVQRGFDEVNGRIDNMLSFMGAHHLDHEQRIRVLEERVLGKSG